VRSAALLPLAFAFAASAAHGAEEIYYGRDSNGALVLTNVPSHKDLRTYTGAGPLPGARSGEEYRPAIWRAALTHGVRPELVYAVASVESNFNPRAVSAKGAQGLMQLMPETAARFGVADPWDPVENIVGGVRYLRYLLDMFGGDQRLALAAYNAGENAVQATRTIPPYEETRAYVAKVLRLFGRNRDPYVRSPGTRGAGGPSAPQVIYNYTDAQGVVHYLDQPPGATPTPPGSASRPQ
jgi:transglycosylase-like protein with SLT domain/uncharacterized protein DUF4124